MSIPSQEARKVYQLRTMDSTLPDNSDSAPEEFSFDNWCLQTNLQSRALPL